MILENCGVFYTERFLHGEINIMKIYASEISDGIRDIISKNNSVTLASVISDIPTDSHVDASVLANMSNLDKAFATNEGQFDLHYVNTILVSTGWNKNDDVFDKSEVWSARKTPEDKPFNYEHDPSDIIGHITGNQVINAEGTLVPDDSSLDNIPEKFHILTSGVLYKHVGSRDEELEQRMSGIIEGISNGEWFVSMEALFNDFDYAIITPGGENKIIARDEESAFLTKHLRSYGGDGTYQDYKVGRLIKNITFSGKGLVRKPANPESVFVFNDINSFAAAEAEAISSIDIENVYSSILNKENDSMSENHESLQREVAELRERLKEMDEAAVKARFADLNAEVLSRDEKIQTLEEASQAAQEIYNELLSAKENLEKQLSESNEASEKISQELNKIREEILLTSRISTLVDAGLEKSNAEEAAAKFADLNDEQFSEIAKIFDGQTEAADDEAEESTEEAVEAEEAASDPEADPAEVVAEEEVLQEAETSEEVSLTAAGETDAEEQAEMMGALADYLNETIHR